MPLRIKGGLAQQIRRLYPGTDLSECIFFDYGRKMDAFVELQRLYWIAVSVLVGRALFLVFVATLGPCRRHPASLACRS
jgi:hypothetical protein